MKNILILLMSLLFWQTSEAQVPELIYEFDKGCDNYINPEFTKVQNKVFLVGCTNEEGRELWKTDGTSSGTEIVSDILAGEEDGLGSFQNGLEFGISLGENLYFSNKDIDSEIGDDYVLMKDSSTINLL